MVGEARVGGVMIVAAMAREGRAVMVEMRVVAAMARVGEARVTVRVR